MQLNNFFGLRRLRAFKRKQSALCIVLHIVNFFIINFTYGKKNMLHILNTPRPDFTELDRQIEEEEDLWLNSLDKQTRRRVLATPSY